METTVAKGLSVLELLLRSKKPMRLSSVAETLQLHKSNVYRLLHTLIELGYARQHEETGRYYATLKTWELSVGVLSTHPARRAAAPYLQTLHAESNATVNLTLPDGDEVMFIERAASSRVMRVAREIGSRAPMALTASGRVFLSAREDAKAVLERAKATLPAAADLDVAAVLDELETVRQRGYAMTVDGRGRGVATVAAPIMGHNEKPAAAIAISASKERFTGDYLRNVTDLLISTCSEIGEIDPL